VRKALLVCLNYFNDQIEETMQI